MIMMAIMMMMMIRQRGEQQTSTAAATAAVRKVYDVRLNGRFYLKRPVTRVKRASGLAGLRERARGSESSLRPPVGEPVFSEGRLHDRFGQVPIGPRAVLCIEPAADAVCRQRPAPSAGSRRSHKSLWRGSRCGLLSSAPPTTTTTNTTPIESQDALPKAAYCLLPPPRPLHLQTPTYYDQELHHHPQNSSLTSKVENVFHRREGGRRLGRLSNLLHGFRGQIHLALP